MNITQTNYHQDFELFSEYSYTLFLVIWGSKTHKAHIISRQSWGIPDPYGIDPVHAVYDGDMMRVRAHQPRCSDKLIPCLGVFATWEEAMNYSDKLYKVAKHKTEEFMSFITNNVEQFRHTGRKTYNKFRRGLWTAHFPTWEEHLTLCEKEGATI